MAAGRDSGRCAAFARALTLNSSTISYSNTLGNACMGRPVPGGDIIVCSSSGKLQGVFHSHAESRLISRCCSGGAVHSALCRVQRRLFPSAWCNDSPQTPRQPHQVNLAARLALRVWQCFPPACTAAAAAAACRRLAAGPWHAPPAAGAPAQCLLQHRAACLPHLALQGSAG